MKKFASLLLIFIIGYAPGLVNAQDCNTYYPLKEGVRLEYAMYDKKDKPEGTQWQEVTGVRETSDGVEAKMKIGFVDKKGKPVYETEYGFVCDGNVIRVDYQSLMAGPAMEQFKDMEVELTGTDLEIPNNLHEEQDLKDASVTMKINMGGMNMNSVVEMTNRRVEKMEKVTTPAGTFDCAVLYSETRSKMMMADRTFPSRTWMAKDVGVVKSESYNKKGEVVSRMELTAIN